MTKRILMIFLVVLMAVVSGSCKKQNTPSADIDKGAESANENTDDSPDKSSSPGVTKVPEAGGSGTDTNNPIALYNCSIIDGTGAAVLEDGVILISGGQIEQIGPSDTVQIPEGYQKIDLNKSTVLPGFINTHVHEAYNETNLKDWLSGGVTTVRDLASMLSNAVSLRDAFNLRSDVSRIVSATPIITVPNGYGHAYYSSAEEAGQLVKEFADEGYDVIKFSIEDYEQARSWSIGTLEEWQAIVDAAHAAGKRAVAHISHAKFLQQAADIGLDEIAHMVTEPIDEDICKTIADKGIYWIPTLELWHGVSEMYDIDYDKIAIRNLSMFYNAGGKIALGTDSNGYVTEFDRGFPITEVKLMKEAGMSNMDIILAGTRNAAECCDRDDIGTLEAGKIADLLVVEGNPLDDIEDLNNTYMVIHNGQIAFQK